MGFMLGSSNGPTVNHITVVTQSITYTENHLSPPLLGPWFLPSFFNKNILLILNKDYSFLLAADELT